MASSLEQLIFEIIATDKGASAAFDKFRGKVDAASKSVDSNSNSLEKSAESLLKQRKAADDAGNSADTLRSKLTTLLGSTAGAGGSGIAGLVGAGVALSPVLVTLGTGFAGLGAAAYGLAKPIENAAQQTGGLKANLASLDPEQRKVATGVLALGKQFGVFQQAVKPEVMGIFSQGLTIAGHVLKDIEPVTIATGKAFEAFLGQIDKTFQGGEFQQFFKFMAATAGPDMKLLGAVFISLLKDVPPLVESLQPLAVGLLKVTNVAAELLGWLGKLHLAIPLVGATIGFMVAGPLGALVGATAATVIGLAAMGRQASDVQPVFDRVQKTMGNTGSAIVQVNAAVTRFGTSAGQVLKPVSNLSQAQQELVRQEVAAQNAILAAHPAFTSYGKDLAGAAGSSRDLSNNAAAAGQATFNLKLAALGASGPARDLSNHVSGVAQSAFQMKIQQEGASGATRDLSNNAVAAARSSNTLGGKVKNLSDASQIAAKNLNDVWQKVSNLHNAEQKSLSTFTSYNDALIAQYNSAAQLNQALGKSHDKVGLLTQNQRNSFSAADTYINNTIKAAQTAGTNSNKINDVITSLRNELPRLQSVKGGTQAYWQEVRTLVRWLDTLRRERAIQEIIKVSGHGEWAVSGTTGTSVPLQRQFPGRRAARGMLVTAGTTPTADDVLIRASRGELVVPAGMVASGMVNHLRGSIPGFASGGVVGSFSGTVSPGLPGFVNQENKATVNAIASAVASAVHTALTAPAVGGFGATPGGGAPAANAALARRMYPPWGSGAEWAAWNAVAMRESGWNQFARNPTSGAYGIPQALPASKMGPAANPPASNPGAQIAWMISYIRSVYGDPIRAWAHELSAGWYDQGGYLPVGASIAVNTTGRPEPVGGARGPLVNVQTMVVQDATNATIVAKKLSYAITASGFG